MPEHLSRLAGLQARAWPNRSDEHRRMRRWTNQVGYVGHYLTKSRRYPPPSARSARPAGTGNSPAVASNAPATPNDRSPTSRTHTPPVEHVQVDDHTDSAADPARFVLVVEWRLDGIGWQLPGDALLARTARNSALAARVEAREQRHRERELRALID